MTYASVSKAVKPYVCHGVALRETGGDEYVGQCPVCEADDHFYVNGDTGLYDCKRCGCSGNIITYLTHRATELAGCTTTAEYRKLGILRKIPWKVFKRYQLGWDGEYWNIPCRNVRGNVVDLRRWKPGSHRVLATAGGTLHLFGLQNLPTGEVDQLGPSRSGIVWLCEGEWDALAMAELLRRAKRSGDTAIGVPGANVFKRAWVSLFAGRHVRICYDADTPGDRGAAKVAKLLRGIAAKVDFLNWPESLPAGWDIRDQLADCWNTVGTDVVRTYLARKVLAELTKLVSETPRVSDATPTSTEAGVGGQSLGPPPSEYTNPQREVVPKSERPSFDDLVKVFSRIAYMDNEMVLGLRVVLAVILSEQLLGDPLWFQICAPSGGGKSLLLSATRASDWVRFYSSFTPQSLVSGFQVQGGDDPSILSRVNRATLVIKDGTALSTTYDADVQACLGVLRDAYDGHVRRQYGNGVVREYNWLHFSLLMGVTPSIQTFGQAHLGERFLRVHLRRPRRGTDHERRRVMKAIDTVLKNAADADDVLLEPVRRFLACDLDVKALQARKVPRWFKLRVWPLCALVSKLRATVLWKREGYASQELSTRPESEYATRLVKQLVKLAWTSALVDNASDPKIRQSDWGLIVRVARDTCFDFHWDVVTALFVIGKPSAVADIVSRAALHRGTVERRLIDLIELRMIRKLTLSTSVAYEKRGGLIGNLPTNVYELLPEIQELCEQAELCGV